MGDLGLHPDTLRSALCEVLRRRPNPDNWSRKVVEREIDDLLHESEWYEVFDYIEAIAELVEGDPEKSNTFSSAMNIALEEEDIGWRLESGAVIAMTSDGAVQLVRDALRQLDEEDLAIAARELSEAVLDLSRRPEADLTGAIHHAMAALESLARELTGDEKATLGEILKSHGEVVGEPIKTALSKLWGYASNNARHVSEGNDIAMDDAQLVVGIATSVIPYLISKLSGSDAEE